MTDPLDEVCNAIRKLHGDGKASLPIVRYEPIDPGRMGDNTMKPGPYVPQAYTPSESQPLDIPCFPGDIRQTLNVPRASLPNFVESPPTMPYRMDLPFSTGSTQI